jgi:hypothetical protein
MDGRGLLLPSHRGSAMSAKSMASRQHTGPSIDSFGPVASCRPRSYICAMLSRVLPESHITRRRKTLIAANDNASRDASEWRELWLPVLAILALPPMVALAAFIAAAVIL